MSRSRRTNTLACLYGHVPLNGAVRLRLRRQMSGPNRHYHGLDHVAGLWEVHRQFSRGTPMRARRAQRVLAAAIACHDAIYVAGREDNERRSAELWSRLAKLAGRLPRSEVDFVAAVILATSRHTEDILSGGNPILYWMLDLDLSGIGATAHQFARNSARLRAENVSLPVAVWRDRTIGFLAALQRRRGLFYSRRIRRAFGATARENLRSAIQAG